MNLKLYTFLFITSLSLTISQETGIPKSLSLEECYKLALEKNLDALFTKRQEYLAEAQVNTQFLQYLPSADINLFYSRHLNAEDGAAQKFTLGGIVFDLPGAPALPNSYSASGNINYILFNGFARENQYAASKKNLSQVKANNQFTIENIKLNIYRNYLTIALNKQIVNTRKENLKVVQKDLERVKALFESGLAAENDYIAQEVELNNRELELVRAENDYNIAKSNLNNSIGINPAVEVDYTLTDLPLDLNDGEIQLYLTQNSDVDGLINYAIDSRYDYKSTRENLDQLKLNIDVQKGSYYPNLSASLGWNWNNTKIGEFNLGRSFASVNLAVPVFQQYRVDFQIDQAQIQYEEARKNYEMGILSLKNTLLNNILTLKANKKQLEITAKSLIAAEKNFDNVKGRYEAGLLNINDYTIANVNMITSKINRITAVSNFLISKKQLEFNLGRYN